MIARPNLLTTEIAHTRPDAAREVRRWFFVSAALLMIVLCLAGFGPSIIDQTHRNAPSTLLVIAHGVAVGAWLLLFLSQAILVATQRTSVHRRLGIAGPMLALAMIILGYIVLIDFGRRGYDLSGDVIRSVSRTDSSRFNSAIVLFPLSELLSFSVLAGAGLCYRHRPEVHKRLMLLAMVPVLTEPILHFVGHLSMRWPHLRGMGPAIGGFLTLILLSASAI